MVSPTFESFSQNGEDVVLWRALQEIRVGRYIDVGANDPQVFSVTRAFYNRGWRGITVEPDPEFAQMQRVERPRDRQVEAAVSVKDGDTITFHVVDGTGLSTVDANLAQAHYGAGFDTHDLKVSTRTLDSILEEAGWDGLDIHFMSVDTEGSERDVLESIDLSIWRPWILVVEATAPLTTQPTRELWEDLVLNSGYSFCLFDGLSCYYVADEHAASFGRRLSFPACPLDDYTTREYREAERKYRDLAERAAGIPDLIEQVTRWRAQAMNRWAVAIATETEMERLRAEVANLHGTLHNQHVERAGLQQEITDLRRSSSWRVTRPLRFLGGLAGRAQRR